MVPLFSIIIPAYNSENFISNCIKSVINQNIGKINYEIIVVNDGSKDKTLNICKNFNKEKALLRIINNKKNYGVSYSRNLAIRQASGKYIIFIDSDDSLKFNSLKRLVGLLKNSDVDVLMALDLKNVERKHKIEDLERNLFIKEKKLVAFFKLLNTTGRNFGFKPWNFIVSRKFLMRNRIYFKQKIKIFEDQLFASQILCCINKIKIYKGSFHIHKERFGSLNKLMSFAAMESCLQTMNELCKLLKNNMLNYEKKLFLNMRLDFLLKYFKLYLIICNKNQIEKVYYFIKSNIHNLKHIKSELLDKFVFDIKKIKNLFKSLIAINNNSKLLIQNLYKKRHKHIYIYGFGLFGRLLCSIYKKNKFKSIRLVDKNKDFLNNKYLGVKISGPEVLKKISTKNLRKSIVVISFDDITLSKKVYKNLKRNGLSKNNFTFLNWKSIVGKI